MTGGSKPKGRMVWLSPKQQAAIRMAISSAIAHEESIIDAHTKIEYGTDAHGFHAEIGSRPIKGFEAIVAKSEANVKTLKSLVI